MGRAKEMAPAAERKCCTTPSPACLTHGGVATTLALWVLTATPELKRSQMCKRTMSVSRWLCLYRAGMAVHRGFARAAAYPVASQHASTYVIPETYATPLHLVKRSIGAAIHQCAVEKSCVGVSRPQRTSRSDLSRLTNDCAL